MAASDTIVLASDSSDDDCKAIKPGKINGAVKRKKSEPDDDDDDLEIVEIKTDSSFKPKVPLSSSRSEIRKIMRNSQQSSISEFFSKTKEKQGGSSSSSCASSNGKKKYSSSKKDTGSDSERASKRDTPDKEVNSDTSVRLVENFISRWEDIHSSKDDNKIKDKIWKNYYMSHSTYTHSRKFVHMMEGATRKLTVDNIYVVIKDILDCLKRYKDVPLVEKVPEEAVEKSGSEAENGSPMPEETEEEKRRNSRLRKVDKKMKQIADKIQELENSEVDLDDENNSAYLVEERLKRQFSKLHEYYCKLAECSSATGRPIERKFKYTGSRWSEINKRISAWVNKNKEFPDYVDILKLVKKVTEQSNLPLRPETVRVQAQEIFRDVGMMLKERRESDDLYSIYSYSEEVTEDPATNDDGLNQKLIENEELAKTKLDKVFQEFVEKEAETREEADKIDKKKKGFPVKKEIKKEKVKTEDNSETKVEGENENNSETKVEGKKEDKTEVKTDAKIESEKKEEATGDIDNEKKEKVNDVGNKDGADAERHEPNSDSKENDTNKEGEEEEEDDEDDDSGKYDVDDEDSEETEEEEEEGVESGEVGLHSEKKSSTVQESDIIDDGEETDDDLKNMLASACVEEEESDSEEDVPVGSQQDLDMGIEESDDDIVCLDDEYVLNQSPLKSSAPFQIQSVKSLNTKKRSMEFESSSQKRLCVETSAP